MANSAYIQFEVFSGIGDASTFLKFPRYRPYTFEKSNKGLRILESVEFWLGPDEQECRIAAWCEPCGEFNIHGKGTTSRRHPHCKCSVEQGDYAMRTISKIPFFRTSQGEESNDFPWKILIELRRIWCGELGSADRGSSKIERKYYLGSTRQHVLSNQARRLAESKMSFPDALDVLCDMNRVRNFPNLQESAIVELVRTIYSAEAQSSA